MALVYNFTKMFNYLLKTNKLISKFVVEALKQKPDIMTYW